MIEQFLTVSAIFILLHFVCSRLYVKFGKYFSTFVRKENLGLRTLFIETKSLKRYNFIAFLWLVIYYFEGIKGVVKWMQQ